MKRTKKLKVKWKNVGILATGNSCGWTWFGFITFILSCAVLGEVVDYISEEFKK